MVVKKNQTDMKNQNKKRILITKKFMSEIRPLKEKLDKIELELASTKTNKQNFSNFIFLTIALSNVYLLMFSPIYCLLAMPYVILISIFLEKPIKLILLYLIIFSIWFLGFVYYVSLLANSQELLEFNHFMISPGNIKLLTKIAAKTPLLFQQMFLDTLYLLQLLVDVYHITLTFPLRVD